MREIVLDTETTGLNPKEGHRIVEIGCVELDHHTPTGREFHHYINPERDMPQEAFNIHGLSEDFLSKFPIFSDIADEFLDFIGNSQLVIHNASFDMQFLNSELKLIGKPIIPTERATDTVLLARQRFPGTQVNLDALCNRFGIDNASRTKHGALLDSDLLAKVYIELLGGKQINLSFANNTTVSQINHQQDSKVVERLYKKPRLYVISKEEKEAHEILQKQLNNPIWSLIKSKI